MDELTPMDRRSLAERVLEHAAEQSADHAAETVRIECGFATVKWVKRDSQAWSGYAWARTDSGLVFVSKFLGPWADRVALDKAVDDHLIPAAKDELLEGASGPSDGQHAGFYP